MLGLEGNVLRKIYTGYPYPQLDKSQDELLYNLYSTSFSSNKGISYDAFISSIKSSFIASLKDVFKSTDLYKINSNLNLDLEKSKDDRIKNLLYNINTRYNLDLRYYPFLDYSFLSESYNSAKAYYESYKQLVERYIELLFCKKINIFNSESSAFITTLDNNVVLSVPLLLDNYLMSFFSPNLLYKYKDYYLSHKGSTIYLDADKIWEGYDLSIIVELVNHYKPNFLLSQAQKAVICYNLDLEKNYVAKATLMAGEDSFLAKQIRGVFNTNIYPEFNLFEPTFRGNSFYIKISNFKSFHNCFSGKLNSTLLEYLVDNTDYIKYILCLSVFNPDYPIKFRKDSPFNFTLEDDMLKILLK